jgi:hypothetical protein
MSRPRRAAIGVLVVVFLLVLGLAVAARSPQGPHGKSTHALGEGWCPAGTPFPMTSPLPPCSPPGGVYPPFQ